MVSEAKASVEVELFAKVAEAEEMRALLKSGHAAFEEFKQKKATELAECRAQTANLNEQVREDIE
jgi:uncharacterized protein YeaO (DUF488 family)